MNCNSLLQRFLLAITCICALSLSKKPIGNTYARNGIDLCYQIFLFFLLPTFLPSFFLSSLSLYFFPSLFLPACLPFCFVSPRCSWWKRELLLGFKSEQQGHLSLLLPIRYPSLDFYLISIPLKIKVIMYPVISHSSLF